uniref:Uncharacterized protein n=1 Tax=Guillardia theta (strain CCMP2712) TaxID=905079 RepID=A0A0C3SGI6_GUITC
MDVDCIAFHPNCNYIATGGTDRTVRVWDTVSGNQIRIYRGHSTGVSAVRFSHDGLSLASGGDNGEVLLWNLSSDRLLSSYQGHAQMVTALDFSYGGEEDRPVLASGSMDGTVKLWDGSGRKEEEEAIKRSRDGGKGGRSDGERLGPIKSFWTRRTPIATLRFGASNVLFVAGTAEV